MMVKAKKIIAIISIACVSISAVIGLLLLFNIIEGTGVLGSIMFTLLTLFLGSLLSLNCLDAIDRKNIVGYISEGLIILSSILFIVSIWLMNFESEYSGLLFNIVTPIGAVSVLFSIIVANIMKLGKKLLIIQILTYIIYAVLLYSLCELIMTTEISIDITIIVALIIIVIVFSVVLAVKSKLNSNKSKDMITITKEEYDKMIERIKELENIINKNKGEV